MCCRGWAHKKHEKENTHTYTHHAYTHKHTHAMHIHTHIHTPCIYAHTIYRLHVCALMQRTIQKHQYTEEQQNQTHTHKLTHMVKHMNTYAHAPCLSFMQPLGKRDFNEPVVNGHQAGIHKPDGWSGSCYSEHQHVDQLTTSTQQSIS